MTDHKEATAATAQVKNNAMRFQAFELARELSRPRVEALRRVLLRRAEIEDTP